MSELTKAAREEVSKRKAIVTIVVLQRSENIFFLNLNLYLKINSKRTK